MSTIPYWQQRQAMKLKGATSLTPREGMPVPKVPPPPKKKKPAKRMKKRTKKMAKKMRQLGKINKKLLQDGTVECGIKSPVCTFFATAVNHDAGRVGEQLLKEEDMTPCCQPCNDFIESHHAWAEARGFKKRRHGKK